MMFTRLPWWRIYQPRQEAYCHAVEYWPFVGWLTGGTVAAVYALALPHFASPGIPIVLAILSRILLTGALHEDGLADFCDGMGGGTSRQRILQIMKDSHIGTYGVLGLIVYLMLLYNVLTDVHPLVILLADVWGKSCASLLVVRLPYARPQEEAKTRLVYTPIHPLAHLLRILLAVAPAYALCLLAAIPMHIAPWLAALLAGQLLTLYLRHRIQGYTGDCCGAAFLLCEMAFLLTWTIQT